MKKKTTKDFNRKYFNNGKEEKKRRTMVLTIMIKDKRMHFYRFKIMNSQLDTATSTLHLQSYNKVQTRKTTIQHNWTTTIKTNQSAYNNTVVIKLALKVQKEYLSSSNS